MKKKMIGIVITSVLLLAAVVFGTIFALQYRDSKKSETAFAELQEMVVDETVIPIPKKDDSSEMVVPSVSAQDKYLPLYEKNSDFMGWISIESTNVNYPVMQTPKEPNYYLKHSFEKSWSDYGVPYLDASCFVGRSNNLVIYGHHMNDGSMFADLVKYLDKSFYEEHQTIQFDTLSGYGAYEIIAVFRYDTNHETFFYNKHFDMDEETFNSYVSECKSRSEYDTGVSAEYGDELITLSTCEYSHTNGRFVVVAKRIVEN